jgi:hypothetical protein
MNIQLKSYLQPRVTYAFERTPEDTPLADIHPPELEAEILDDLPFNPWAWCMVTTTCTYKDLTGGAYLGWISHESEESFLASEECEELKETALDQLVYNIEQAATLYDRLTKGSTTL